MFEEYWFFPCTRLPIGRQAGVPSLLDYSFTKDCGAEGFIYWDHAVADHALVLYKLDLQLPAVQRRRRTHWQCTDVQAFMESAVHLSLHEDVSYASFADQLRSLQDAHDTKLSCAIRRRERMPFQLRALMARMRMCTSLAETEHYKKLVW